MVQKKNPVWRFDCRLALCAFTAKTLIRMYTQVVLVL